MVAYPAILYAARITTIDVGSIQRLHRSWAVFVWRSQYEPMRRTNLFWSAEGGGIGLINVELKLVVQRFIFFRDQVDPFLQAAIQCLGSFHLRPWLATSASVDHGSRITGFYGEIANAVASLQTYFSWEYLLTVNPRKLYWDLVAQTLPPPLYRQPPVSQGGGDVLKRVRQSPIPVGTKDFFFRFHAAVLPVMARQQERGFFLPWGAGCLLCGKPETAEQAFLDCNTAIAATGATYSGYGDKMSVSAFILGLSLCEQATDTSESEVLRRVLPAALVDHVAR
ncbi:uncharacterized protein LOC144175760 [Haemaphysalis longicornis]